MLIVSAAVLVHVIVLSTPAAEELEVGPGAGGAIRGGRRRWRGLCEVVAREPLGFGHDQLSGVQTHTNADVRVLAPLSSTTPT